MSCGNIRQDSTVASGITLRLLWTSLVSAAPQELSKGIQKWGLNGKLLWPAFCLSGHRRDFLLPDRSKYVNMEKRFLHSYMDLLVQTCHRRGALATGGMAALLLPQNTHSDSYRRVLNTVTRSEQHLPSRLKNWFYVWEEVKTDKSSFWSFPDFRILDFKVGLLLLPFFWWQAEAAGDQGRRGRFHGVWPESDWAHAESKHWIELCTLLQP